MFMRWLMAALGLFAAVYLASVVASRQTAGDNIARVRRQGTEVLPPGGTELKLLQFYASSGEIVRGEHAIVCYGVENAARVRLDPPIEPIAPAANKCFPVTPQRTTTYHFEAEGADGKRVAASFTINVKPPKARIMELELGKLEVRRGEAWAFCYRLQHAVKAVFEPLKVSLPPTHHCYQFYPPVTMKYSLAAYGEDGTADRYSWKITVHQPPRR